MGKKKDDTDLSCEVDCGCGCLLVIAFMLFGYFFFSGIEAILLKVLG